VNRIWGEVFSYCTSLTNVTIGTSVTNIAGGAFAVCSSLPAISIPDSVTAIGDDAFADCTALTNVTLGNHLAVIGWGTFGGCTRLSRIVIPSSVTRIGNLAFLECTNLRAVYFEGKPPKLDGDAFPGVKPTVYYLPGTTDWGATFGGCATAPWAPQAQTADSSFGVRTNRFSFAISWSSEKFVVIEAATDLSGAAWLPLSTNALTRGTTYFSDPDWAACPRRFYRVRAPLR
jgi:hypothetical protein